nr:immunoglobulin light chain junction region [Macaca mulatta]
DYSCQSADGNVNWVF